MKKGLFHTVYHQYSCNKVAFLVTNLITSISDHICFQFHYKMTIGNYFLFPDIPAPRRDIREKLSFFKEYSHTHCSSCFLWRRKELIHVSCVVLGTLNPSDARSQRQSDICRELNPSHRVSAGYMDYFCRKFSLQRRSKAKINMGKDKFVCKVC